MTMASMRLSAPAIIVITAVIVVIQPSCSQAYIIDLTYALSNMTLFWPGLPEYNFTILHRNQFKYFWMETNYFGTPEHGGTHIDAPSHFSLGKWRIHEIPLDHLIGPGVVIDVQERVRQNPDYLVSVNDFICYENAYGRIPDGAIVLLYTGWGTKYPNAAEVFQTDDPLESKSFHFPGLDPEAASWIVRERPWINGVGIDTPSIDYGQSTKRLTHQTLFSKNIFAMENVANLNRLPAYGATIYCIPIKLFDGSGAPVRIFAIVGERNEVFGKQEEFDIRNSNIDSAAASGTMIKFCLVFLWPLLSKIVC